MVACYYFPMPRLTQDQKQFLVVVALDQELGLFTDAGISHSYGLLFVLQALGCKATLATGSCAYTERGASHGGEHTLSTQALDVDGEIFDLQGNRGAGPVERALRRCVRQRKGEIVDGEIRWKIHPTRTLASYGDMTPSGLTREEMEHRVGAALAALTAKQLQASTASSTSSQRRARL